MRRRVGTSVLGFVLSYSLVAEEHTDNFGCGFVKLLQRQGAVVRELLAFGAPNPRRELSFGPSFARLLGKNLGKRVT